MQILSSIRSVSAGLERLSGLQQKLSLAQQRASLAGGAEPAEDPRYVRAAETRLMLEAPELVCATLGG